MPLTFETRYGEQATGLLDLCSFVKSRLGDSLKIVELGSYCGSSAKIIASSFPNSKIYCVDPWEKYVEDCSKYDIDRQELELIEAELIFDKVAKNYPNIIKNKMGSLQFSKTVEDNSIDLVYIDANHQYTSVRDDILTWLPKVKKGCILAGHDGGWPSVQKAIAECFSSQQPPHTFVDSSWCFFKG